MATAFAACQVRERARGSVLFPSLPPTLSHSHPPARLSQLIKRGEYNALTGAAKLRFFYNKGQGTLAKGANFRDPRS